MEHHWTPIRDDASEAFGDYPSGKLEQELIDHFIADPERVIRTINRLVTSHHRKPFTSPWAVVRADLNRVTVDNVKASAHASRDKLLEQGKTWIRNAGLYHETWDEAATELFGDGATTPPLEYLTELEAQTRDRPGRHLYDKLLRASIIATRDHGQRKVPPDTSAPLYSLRQDDNARDLLHAEWIKTRPRGIQAEAEHEAWNRTAAKAETKETKCQTTSYSQTADPSQSKTATPPTDSSTRSSSFETTSSTSLQTESPNDSSPNSTSATADADDIPHFTPAT